MHEINTELYEKGQIIVSIFVEKISFDDVKHRTARVSEPLDFILLINKGLRRIKKASICTSVDAFGYPKDFKFRVSAKKTIP